MNILFIVVVAIGMMVWYIRPLYNFFAIRKYALLNEKKLTVSKRVQSGLPAVLFYTLIIGLMLYPAASTSLINMFESGTLVVAELVLIFLITRVDKRQTKYELNSTGVNYRNKFITWGPNTEIYFKKTIFFVLHKPRFIMKQRNVRIVIPPLSNDIEQFIRAVRKNRLKNAIIIEDIYHNIKNYYVKNCTLEKKLNK